MEAFLLSIYQGIKAFYSDGFFVAAIGVTFFFGQVAHAYLRGYHEKMRNLMKFFIIAGVQLFVGFWATILLVESHDETRYGLICGINSIALYFGLMWLATKWFKWPKVAMFLSLRDANINNKSGEVDFGKTIQFIRKGRGRK